MSSGISAYGPDNLSRRAPRTYAGSGDAGSLVDLVASSEPATVFLSLAAGCVPNVCDRCIIDITEDQDASYRIEYPPGSASSSPAHPPGSGRWLPDRIAAGRLVAVPFAADDSRSECGGYRGTAVFAWTHRTPTRTDRMIVELLIRNAVRTVAWQRSDQRANALARKAEHLATALQTNRHISAAVGILMGLHRISDDQAFDLLRAASQHTHRKLRDVAGGVLETGWLDPALGPATPPIDERPR